MSIPKILHQTWKTDDVPKVFAKYVESWKENHLDWEYRLWTDEENRRFISHHYSWFLKTYDGYPSPIQRADAIRYFLLHKFGGLYVDLDFMSCKPIVPLLRGRKCVIGKEPIEHCREFAMPKILCNALMATVPGHPFFETVIHRLTEFADPVDDTQPVLTSTGPFMLTRVYDEFEQQESMDVVPSEDLYPLTKEQADQLLLTGEVNVDLSGAYAIHLHYGSWWRPDRQAELGTLLAGELHPNQRRVRQWIVSAIAALVSAIAATFSWLSLGS